MYATAQRLLIVSMFLGLISASPTEVVSIVKLAKVLMNASRSNYGVKKNYILYFRNWMNSEIKLIQREYATG